MDPEATLQKPNRMQLCGGPRGPHALPPLPAPALQGGIASTVFTSFRFSILYPSIRIDLHRRTRSDTEIPTDKAQPLAAQTLPAPPRGPSRSAAAQQSLTRGAQKPGVA